MKNKIIKAVFTLSVFSILDRSLGFVFKIYLSRQLGASFMGIYQAALSVFFVLITLTSSGIPLVVSKLTAKYRKSGDRKAEGGIASAALIVGTILAVLVALIFVLFRKPISKIFVSDMVMSLILILLPAIVCSSIYSAFRGNLWGKERYTAVSLVELLEQVVRIILCILLFLLGFNKIKVTAWSMTVGCAVAAVACMLCYVKDKGRLKSPKGHIIPLIKSSTPITVSRAASSIVNSIVAIVVPFLLLSSGADNEQSMYIFGYSVGMALPLLYIPLTVVGSLAFVMIPTLSTISEDKDKKNLNRQIENAIAFSIIIACLFLPFFSVLGEDIGALVYKNADSGKFLSISAWLLVPLSIENITSSMMNSLDLEMKSFFNYCIGSVVMLALMFAFYKHFTIEILSIGMGISWIVASILHIICIRKKTGLGFKYIRTLIECLLISVPAAFLTQWTFNLTNGIGMFLRLAISGVAGFVFMILLFFVFDIVDIDMFKSKKKKKVKKTDKKREEQTVVYKSPSQAFIAGKQ